MRKISANEKLKWAEQHIRNLHGFWREFVDEKDAYRVAHEDNAKTGCRVYRLKHILPIPPEVSLMLGDAVHNLCCALDHLAYLAAVKFTGGAGPFTGLYFPIGEDAIEFEKALLRSKEYKAKKVGVKQRLGKDVIEALRGIQPYRRGRGELLWNIHELDIRDKHYLVLAVGSTNTLQSMLPSDRAKIKKEFLEIEDDALTPAMESALYLETSVSATIPLKTNTILRSVPFSEVDENTKFVFDVAFGEPQVLQGKPIIVTLHRTAKLIREIIRDFDGAGFLA